MKIGEYTYVPKEIKYGNDDGELTIGKFCSIASEVVILLGGEHNPNNISTFPFHAYWSEAVNFSSGPGSKGNVTIGNDVWIGYGVTILSGVTIGDGAVIGAKSLVVDDVPPYYIVGGVPARAIRRRFTDLQVEKLLKIKWWDWPKEKIIFFLPFLVSNRIDEFI
jgi:acetyltransferase-like isoleucine patch superfamily enzyme